MAVVDARELWNHDPRYVWQVYDLTYILAGEAVGSPKATREEAQRKVKELERVYTRPPGRNRHGVVIEAKCERVFVIRRLSADSVS